MSNKQMGIFLAAAGVALVGLVGMPGPADATPAVTSAVPAPTAAGESGTGWSPGQPTAADVEALNAAQRLEKLERQRQRAEQLDWGRDPFAGPVVSAPHMDSNLRELPALPTLFGISVVGTTRRAILDHEIAQPGDALPSGWTVHAIVPGMVTLGYGSEVRVLQLTDGQG